MYNSVIAPIVSVVLMVIGGFLHIDFTEDEKKVITESIALLVTAGVALWGIIKNHKKPKV